MRKFSAFKVIVSAILGIFCFSISALLAAEPKNLRLREPNSTKTPCGLYLSNLANSAQGTKVADPTPESVLAFFDSNPDLIPRLAYRDRNTAKGYKNAEDLKSAIDAETSEPFVNSVELAWVGLPRWGKKTRELMALTEKKLQEKYPDIKITVRHLWRPNREMSNLASYLTQEFMYLFPSPKLDYQPPIPAEVNSAYSKLAVSNGSQQIFLFFVKPWEIAVTTGTMNFVNSYYTGVYRKVLSNWFSRSKGSPSRWARNIGLSAFFGADLYWAGKGFYGILSLASWAAFVAEKWSSTAFGVLWRYFYGQSIIKWEADYKGHPSDARRTAGRLEFLGTFITTPAFIYSVIAPSLVKLEVLGVPVMGLNGGHFMMMGVGAIGVLYYYKLPSDWRWYIAWITRSRYDGEPPRFTWDPWVSRLDHAHEFNKLWAAKVGLMKLVDFLERGVRAGRAIGWSKSTGWTWNLNGNGNGPSEPLSGDVRDLMDLDHDLVKWLRDDPDLKKLIHEDAELRKLIETDPHFDGIREEILQPQ